MQVKIWVDADAAPRDVRDVVCRAAQRLGVPAVLVANRRMTTPANNTYVSAEWVPGGPDAADRHIAEHASPGDIAVTADIPLAAILVERGVIVVDPRGAVMDEENVRERLSVRDFMESLRGAGVETGGSAPYGERDKRAFAAAFDRVLTAAMKELRRRQQ
jgi:uncharacterized protein